ncbi:hypothetical protein ABBQ32_006533 [Trebouxia sp. C0010 RCD-2024]
MQLRGSFLKTLRCEGARRYSGSAPIVQQGRSTAGLQRLALYPDIAAELEQERRPAQRLHWELTPSGSVVQPSAWQLAAVHLHAQARCKKGLQDIGAFSNGGSGLDPAFPLHPLYPLPAPRPTVPTHHPALQPD